jgi:hypothetical protein
MFPMPTDDPLQLLLQVGLAIALAATCGLRAFLPIFLAAVAHHVGLLQLNEGFSWIAHPATMVIFGLAVVLEVAADKVPALDHALDSFGLALRPIAGALVAAAALGELDASAATASGLVLGGSSAGVVQLIKAKLRLASTATTGGLLNPFVSLAEDGLALGTAATVILVPALTVFVVAVVAGLAILLYRIIARIFVPRARPAVA